MALGSYGTALGWLGSETGKSSIRVFLDYKQLCTGKLDISAVAREKANLSILYDAKAKHSAAFAR